MTLLKTAGLLVLAGFGAYHRYCVLPALAHDAVAARFTSTLRREIVIMVVVILLGGLLAYMPPPPHSAVTPPSHPLVP